MTRSVLIVTLILLFSIPGISQRHKILFESPEGKVFSKKQLDSLWYASGNSVALNFKRKIPRTLDTVGFSITPLTKTALKKRLQSGGYCCNKKKLAIAEIRKQPFYKEIASIKLTSFKKESENWTRQIPKTNGQVNLDSMFEVKNLDRDLENMTLDALINYDGIGQEEMIVFCYEPRNAILFMDKNNQVIGYVEICFECLKHKAEPKDLNIGIPYEEKMEVLRQIFMASGIKYGMNEFEDYFQD